MARDLLLPALVALPCQSLTRSVRQSPPSTPDLSASVVFRGMRLRPASG